MATEKELLEKIEALEQTNRELTQALEQAQATNRAKSQFISDMGHELRTPLTAVMGYSEMLQEEADPQSAQDLQKIWESGNYLLNTINNMVNLAKLEIGTLETYLEAFPISALLPGLQREIAPQLERNQTHLEVQLADNLGTMHADMSWTRQILGNLLHNTAKFTRQRTITLHIERSTRQGRDWIDFRLTGAQVDLTFKDLQKLFREGTDQVERKHNNTTLHLLISRRYCQVMGGDFTVTNDNGTDYTFVFSLPAQTDGPLS